MAIIELLPIGKENRISQRDLMRLAGIRDPRALRAAIHRERCAGNLILATTESGGGYYRHANQTELRDWLNRNEGQAKAIFATLKAARHELQSAERV